MESVAQQLASLGLPFGAPIRAIDDSARCLLKDLVPAGTKAVVLTYGISNQILMMLPEQWFAFTNRINRLDPFDPDVQDIKRFQIAPAAGCLVDNAVRLRIPEEFRIHAELSTPGGAQILNVGNDGYELWLPKNFREARELRKEPMREAQLRLSRQAAAQDAQPPSGA